MYRQRREKEVVQMDKEMGQIKITRTDEGFRIDVTGDTAKLACCCCCTPADEKAVSECCPPKEEKK